MLEQFLITLGGTATAFVVVGFLSRNLVSQFLAKDLERFRSRLAKEEAEHGVRFQTLHAKRVALYEQIGRMKSDVFQAVANLNHWVLELQKHGASRFPDVSEKKAIELTDKAYALTDELTTLYLTNKQFIDRDMLRTLHHFTSLAWSEVSYVLDGTSKPWDKEHDFYEHELTLSEINLALDERMRVQVEGKYGNGTPVAS